MRGLSSKQVPPFHSMALSRQDVTYLLSQKDQPSVAEIVPASVAQVAIVPSGVAAKVLLGAASLTQDIKYNTEKIENVMRSCP